MREMDMERMNTEVQETQEVKEQTEAVESAEQTEMNEGVLEAVSKEEAAEQAEMNEGAKIGYSSDHYKWEYERALASGNEIWAKNSLNNYARAKAREQLG